MFKVFSRTLDKHAPYKEIRKKNDIVTLKPWITKGIKQSIKVRDRLYKDMIRTKNIQLHQIKEKHCKKYRNKTVDLIKKTENRTTINFLKKAREIPMLYGKVFMILYILKRAIDLTLRLHCF